jgi:hypothetical protein
LWEELEINFFPGMKAGGPGLDGLSPEGKSKLFEERTRWIFESDEYQPEGFALPPNVIRTSEKPEAAPVILLSFTFVESLGFRPGDIVDGNDLYVVSIYTAYNLLIRVINRNVLLVCLPDNLSSMELTGSIRQFGDPEMGWQTVSREEREELISLLRKSTHPQATLIVQKLTEL